MNSCIGACCEVRGTCAKWLHLDFATANEARMYFCPTDRATDERTMYEPVFTARVIPLVAATERRAAA
jgi:hypothetical protein